MARHEDEYNWLDDPFNDKKSEAKMNGGGKAFVGIGCVVAAGLVIALIVMMAMALAGLAESF